MISKEDHADNFLGIWKDTLLMISLEKLQL